MFLGYLVCYVEGIFFVQVWFCGFCGFCGVCAWSDILMFWCGVWCKIFSCVCGCARGCWLLVVWGVKKFCALVVSCLVVAVCFFVCGACAFFLCVDFA